MNRRSLAVGAILGFVTSFAVIGLMYLGERAFGLPFVPFDIFDWMTRVLPGPLLTFGIDTMVTIIIALPLGETSSAAKIAEQSLAVLQLAGGGAVLGLALTYLTRDERTGAPLYGLIGGMVFLAATLMIENSIGYPPAGIIPSALWLSALFLAWGWVLGGLIRDAEPALANEPGAALTRRQFLGVAGIGSLVVALGGWGLGRLSGSSGEEEPTADFPDDVVELTGDDPYGASLTSGPAQSPSPAELAGREEPARGTRPDLTSNEDFYRIDINTGPVPNLSAGDWRLRISGLVDNELSLSLEDLRAMPSVTQILTMACISNRIGGDLTGTTSWTGVRFKDVLALVGLKPEAEEAFIRSADDFFEGVKMDDMMDERTLLVYDMNGVPLTKEHGFPLRIFIPNRYGMKQPKWIESIQLVDDEVQGFWVIRGWSKNAFVHTTSVVDTVAVDMMTGGPEGSKMVAAGGIAWAGARGISKVEVQVNDGPWEEARLLTPALSPLTWVRWKYDWEYEPGRHTFSVRCVDGTGDLQTDESAPPRPDGATGIHSTSVRI